MTMANITRRGQSAGDVGLDPVRLMREMLQWDPFAEMLPSTVERGGGGFQPRFEVKETRDSYVFKADLPGVKEEDVDISLTGNRLTVSGKREGEERSEGERYFAYECTYGAFSRSFTMPDDVDAEHVHAELKDGVLTLVVPKRPEAQPRKITLRPGGDGQKTRTA
jgi:HSP20 family protein